ncbi:MAG: hypothetical protein JXQ29_08535 [Planctomycetes bacterium]|nr:hypothetical protein [Planctomycetota bacterium]
MTRMLTALALLLAASVLAGAQAEPAAAGENPPAVPLSGDTRIQLSFQGADINTVVQWLARTTGKSVIAHKEVQCKLSIVSSQTIPLREALAQVYRALALEGFSAIENASTILIVPEKIEPKVSADLLRDLGAEMPSGRHKVIRVFDLRHAEAAKLKDQLKPVLSEQAKIEADERANKLIVTDLVEHVRFLGELLVQLDVPAEAESVTRVFALKHTRADDLATLLTAVFSATTPRPAASQGQPQGKPPSPPRPAAAAGAERVAILADKTSNRLVVCAAPRKMPEIETLIETLDTEKPADVAVRLVPLRNVDAAELVTEVNRLYAKMSGATLKETIEIASVARSNALIVLSSEANFRAIQELAEALDVEEGTDKAMRIFPLKHADSDDVASQLEDLHDTRADFGWGSYGRRSARGRYGSVRFVSHRRQNEVIAIGPPAALDRVAELVEKLDQPAGEEELAPRIFPLKYVAARDIEEVLNALFKKSERRAYWWDDMAEDSADIGRLYGKVRIASEPATNAIIVTTNSVENFAAVERLLAQLDVRSEDREATLNVALRYAKAPEMANNLNILLAGEGAPARRAPRPAAAPAPRPGAEDAATGFELESDDDEETFFPWLGGQSPARARRDGTAERPVSDLVGKVRIVPDARTNSLLITTSPHFFPQILRVVESLDIPTAQVLVEARILEVGREGLERIGVRWSPDGSRVFDTNDFDSSFLPRGSVEFSEVFAGTALENALRTGILDAGVNLDVLLQFLAKKTQTRVRSAPRLNVADNERGKLFVGSRIPFISRSLTTTEGGQNVSFEYRDVGITLEVTPHINQRGEVALKVRVESSQIRPGETLFGGAIIDTRNYRTELTVMHGQTLVLGGIIQQKESEVVRKVPLLGDIPVLGWWLFRKRDTEVQDVELMVFLRPTVTRTPEDVARLMESELQATPQIREFAPDTVGAGAPAEGFRIVTW